MLILLPSAVLSSLISVPDKVAELPQVIPVTVQATSFGSVGPPACFPSLMTPEKVPEAV